MENGKNAIDDAIKGMDKSDLKTVLVSEGDGGTAGDVVGNISASDLKALLVGEQVLCNEGGNKFSYAVRINQENAEGTMEDVKKVLKEFFGMTDDEIIFTGSTGRKLPGSSSGDVDCCISMKKLKDKFGMEKPEEWQDLCKEFAQKYNLDIDLIPGLGFEGVSFAFPIHNSDGKQEGKFVQLDLDPVENLKLRSWSLYMDNEKEGEPYVKGLVRCLLLIILTDLADFKAIETGKVNKREGEQPTKFEKYSYSYQSGGLYRNTYERPLMKGKQGEQGIHKAEADLVDKKLVTDDPDEICEILFGVDSANMLTWQDAWGAAKKMGIFDDEEKKTRFRKFLKKNLERSIKKGNLPYLPPEIAEFLDIDVDSLFGTKKKKWDN